jgi:hypothetical protein
MVRLMDESKTFLGVPQAVVLAVGKMVLAAARVEHFATDIAYQVGVPDAKDLAMDWLRKAIQAHLNADGVPEGLAVTATEIKTWLAEAAAVYGRRSGSATVCSCGKRSMRSGSSSGSSRVPTRIG